MNQENNQTTEMRFKELIRTTKHCIYALEDDLEYVLEDFHYEFEVTLKLLTKELDYYKMIQFFNGEIDEAFIIGSTYKDGQIMRRFDDLLNRLIFITENYSICEVKQNADRIQNELFDCQHYFWSLFGVLLYYGTF